MGRETVAGPPPGTRRSTRPCAPPRGSPSDGDWGTGLEGVSLPDTRIQLPSEQSWPKKDDRLIRPYDGFRRASAGVVAHAPRAVFALGGHAPRKRPAGPQAPYIRSGTAMPSRSSPVSSCFSTAALSARREARVFATASAAIGWAP